MTPFITDQDFTLYVGDVRDVLRELPAESVHCVVTSPPYWGLRDYGTGSWEGGNEDCDHETVAARNGRGGSGAPGKQTAGAFPSEFAASECGKCGARRTDQQLGLEPTPDEYVENMVGVFREVKRVLRRDGTCWLNIGDSYNANQGAGFNANARIGHQNTVLPSGLPPKNLIGMPWRLAFALQQAGWYLRSEIIWAKPNPMPESVTDRPTKSHEQVFLLTRSPRYFYDADAVREAYGHGLSEGANIWDRARETSPLDDRPNERGTRRTASGPDGRRKTIVQAGDNSAQHRDGERWPNPSGRNLRSVWQIATEAYPDAHFATFPQALVEPCVKAGTSEHGCCPVCGAPWERETTVDYENPGNRTTNGPRSVEASRRSARRATVNSRGSRLERRVETTGWRPTCDHGLGPVPCMVLDPFMGSGTVAVVARRLGRHALGIELSPEYARLAARRTQQLPLLAGVTA